MRGGGEGGGGKQEVRSFYGGLHSDRLFAGGFAKVLALAPPTVPLVMVIMIMINISNPVAQPTCLERKVLSLLILRTT